MQPSYEIDEVGFTLIIKAFVKSSCQFRDINIDLEIKLWTPFKKKLTLGDRYDNIKGHTNQIKLTKCCF